MPWVASGAKRICGSFYCVLQIVCTRGDKGATTSPVPSPWGKVEELECSGAVWFGLCCGLWGCLGRIVKILHIVFALGNCYFYDLVCVPQALYTTYTIDMMVGWGDEPKRINMYKYSIHHHYC